MCKRKEWSPERRSSCLLPGLSQILRPHQKDEAQYLDRQSQSIVVPEILPALGISPTALGYNPGKIIGLPPIGHRPQASTLSSLRSDSSGQNQYFILTITVTFELQTLHTSAMLDFGATHCYIDEYFVKEHCLATVDLKEPLPISVIDGRPVITGAATHITTAFSLAVLDHHENVALDITST